jgi:ABC-type lipoprotein release transport system permease subunit
MTLVRLLLRGLLFHGRANSAVALGVLVGTAVLTGALLVGDSLRGSLRDLTQRQLEWVDHALVAGRFVRQELAAGLPADRVAPALLLQGAAGTVPPEGGNELPRRAGRVTVLGVDERFWSATPPVDDAFWKTPPGGDVPGVVLNEPLARELGVRAGDRIVLHLQKTSAVPRETLLGRRDADSVLARLPFTVRAVLADGAAGNQFNLSPSAAAPRNAFVPLAVLQERLGLSGRVNALLAGGGRIEAIQDTFRQHLTLDDWGLVVRDPAGRTEELLGKLDRDGDGKLARAEWQRRLAESVARDIDTSADGILTREETAAFYATRRGYLSLESRQLILEPALVAAAQAAADDLKMKAAPTFVYLAHTLSGPDGSEVPYVIVAGLDPELPPPLGPFLPPGEKGLANHDIILADWKDSPLKVKPGDRVGMGYFRPVEGGHLEDYGAVFQVRGLVPLEGVAADPDLTPEFPGITDKLEMTDWDPPFPYDPKRVQRRDEEFWRQYRTTPRAYITPARAESLWGSRFGKTTSVRLAPPAGTEAPIAWTELREQYEARLLARLEPAQGGLAFDAVRQRGLQASTGGTDFGMLFLGFSFFLIVASLLLVGLLFRLNLDRRASEVGLLLATGYRRRTVLGLLLAEGGVIAAVGGLLGLLAAILYARLLLDLLRALWPGGMEHSFLQPHVTLLSLALGFGAALLVSLLTIFLALLALRRVPPRALLDGETTVSDETSATPRGSRWGLPIGLVAAVAAVGLVAATRFVTSQEQRALIFFTSGALLLVACLAAAWAWLRRSREGHGSGRAAPALAVLGVRNAARHPVRSLLTAGLLASAAFLLVAVESFRREASADFLARGSGSGGFALFAESDVPIYQDLNDEKGRAEIADSLERQLRDRERVAALQAELGSVAIVPLRVRAGDDASCLNLYRPNRPRLLGVPITLTRRGGFRFSGTLAELSEERSNPWLLLEQPLRDGAIPVIGEANTVEWMLKSGLGKDIEVPDERGNPVKLRVVALLHDSIFQSGLLMSEGSFLKLYPSHGGYNLFLIDTPPERADQVKTVLEMALGDRGFEVTPSLERLQAYLAVENTYLSTFQALGGLGLFLGTLGLAVVLLRSVWERRSELALLRALGYRHRALGWLLLSENGFLLVAGLAMGTAAALLAVAPHLAGGEGPVPWPRPLGLLAVVLVTGLVTASIALATTLRAPLIPALRRE